MAYFVYMKDVILPVTPAKIEYKINGRNETMSLINGGEVNQIKSPRLTEISFECMIPQVQYPFAYYQKKFHGAKYYLDKFENMKKSKKPFEFKVTRSTPNFKGLFDTSILVTLENYTITEDAEEGMDVIVSFELKQYINYGIEVIKEITDSNGTKKKVAKKGSTRSKREVSDSYIVKKGDSLWKIAKKELDDTSKWKSIYTLNESVIETAAKKHGRKSSSKGHWIYPGTKLKLPK